MHQLIIHVYVVILRHCLLILCRKVIFSSIQFHTQLSIKKFYNLAPSTYIEKMMKTAVMSLRQVVLFFFVGFSLQQ